MRRILIDNARRKLAAKHDGKHQRADFDLDSLEDSPDDARLIELNDAMTKFAEVDATKADLVKLRYFAGCSIKDAAELLGMPQAADSAASYQWPFHRRRRSDLHPLRQLSMRSRCRSLS